MRHVDAVHDQIRISFQDAEMSSTSNDEPAMYKFQLLNDPNTLVNKAQSEKSGVHLISPSI